MGGPRCRHTCINSDTPRPYRQNRNKRNLFDESQIKLVHLAKDLQYNGGSIHEHTELIIQGKKVE